MLGLRERGSALRPVAADRWHGPVDGADDSVLERARPPVLDVGCGPGRHVLALAERGIPALGVDASPAAAGLARSRGAPVLERSVFDRIPRCGRWGSALLLDGNVGIGGDPRVLFTRVGALVAPGAPVLVELEPPGSPTKRAVVRWERPEEAGPWFPWAQVGVDGVEEVAGGTGLEVEDTWCAGERWFAALVRPR